MIYKKAENINLDQFRVIHLFKADFNLPVGISTMQQTRTALYIGISIENHEWNA